jgi:uracil phosphoribosyltransferase
LNEIEKNDLQMIHILGNNNTILNLFLAELRDVSIQQDRMRFRKNLERIGEVMAYEISKKMKYVTSTIQTPLGITDVKIPEQEPVIATILRAGLPFHQGFLNYFDKAGCAFVTAFRKHSTEFEFTIQVDYVSCPDLTGKVLIITDPMLATGWSVVAVYRRLLEYGQPAHTHIASVVSAKPGVKYVESKLPMDQITLWIGAIDNGLNDKSYIVPGLGDAGDLAYGEKI